MAQRSFDGRVEFRDRIPTANKKSKMQNGEWRENPMVIRRYGEPMNSDTGYNQTGSWRPPSTHYGALRVRTHLYDHEPANKRNDGDRRDVFRTSGGVDEHNQAGERVHYRWGSRDRGSSNGNFQELQKLREENRALLEELEDTRHTNGILKRQLESKIRESQQRTLDIQLLEVRLQASEDRNWQLQRELRTARFGAFGPRKRIKKANAFSFGNGAPARPKQRRRFTQNNKSKQTSPVNKHGDVDLRTEVAPPDHQRQQQLPSKPPTSSPMRQLQPSTSWDAEALKQPFTLDAAMEEILKPSKNEPDTQVKGKSTETLSAEVDKILAALGGDRTQ